MFRWHVISAIFSRNLKQYFTSVLGYLFIVAFVTVCTLLTFSPQFFADNLANLDQLSRYFPLILLLFIPAITMPLWADERRQGTDSILFTLPASDFDVLMGKYLAGVAVYTFALLFSMVQLMALEALGDPDWGVVLTTYLGYWLAGAALIAVGMFASSLTGNTTVAFVLGAVFCAVPVLISFLGERYGLNRYTVGWHLDDFTNGQISLSSIVYFVGLAAVMLYLNIVVISKRHWNRGAQGNIGWQLIVRAVALGCGVFALFHLVDNSPAASMAQLDMTREKLFQLHPTTLETLDKVRDSDREVTIQAFISDNMPQKYTNVKKEFEGMLRRFDSFGGENVDVILSRVKPNSDDEIAARKLGIDGVDDRSEVDGVTTQRKVFLGAKVSSSAGDTVLPFISSNQSIEYELSHALFTTIEKGNKPTVGILDSDARFGGVMLQGRRIPWAYRETVDQLEEQFKVKYIEPGRLASYLPEPPKVDDTKEGQQDAEEGTPKDDSETEQLTPPDVLIVADPASLDIAAMPNLIKYIEAGNPTILLADPLPFFWAWQNPTNLGILNAPRMPRVDRRSQYAEVLASSEAPKADNGTASSLFAALGVDWDNGAAVWNTEDPHPGFEPFWPPYLGDRWPDRYGPQDKAFVYIKDNAEEVVFNPEDNISSGLRELLFFYPGYVRPGLNSKYDFIPLVSLGSSSGKTPWNRLTETPVQTMQMLNPRTGKVSIREEPARSQITGDNLIVLRKSIYDNADSNNYVVAARLKSKEDSAKKVDVVIITDLDFLSSMSVEQEDKLNEDLGQQLDNQSLLLNAIEVLSGSDGFVELRNRRPQPRTLTRLESIFKKFRQDRLDQQKTAEEEVEKELAGAQANLDAATEEIQQNQSLSFLEKLQQTSQRATDVQRKFELKQRKLDRELEEKILELKITEQDKVRSEKEKYRWLTTLIAPLPPLMLGMAVMWFRAINEQRNINPKRRAK